MRRFFFAPEDRRGDRVRLAADESRHLLRVLRLKIGDEVELIDGSGAVWGAVICGTGRNAELVLGERRAAPAEPGAPLSLFQALLTGEKMDLVVQKATELGAEKLVPVQTLRSQRGAADRHRRWQRISVGACKQSLRPRLMEIAGVCTPGDFSFGLPPACLKLLFWEEERVRGVDDVAAELVESGRTGRPVALFVGPEGGFAGEEVAAAQAAGWQTVGLGGRILRAETASMTVLAVVGYLSGHFICPSGEVTAQMSRQR